MRPTPPKPKFLQPWSARRWRLLVSSNFRNDSYIRDLSDTCRRLTLDRLYQRRASAQTPPIFCAQATERTFVLGICPAPLWSTNQTGRLLLPRPARDDAYPVRQTCVAQVCCGLAGCGALRHALGLFPWLHPLLFHMRSKAVPPGDPGRS
jgi:hypothetical protein